MVNGPYLYSAFIQGAIGTQAPRLLRRRLRTTTSQGFYQSCRPWSASSTLKQRITSPDTPVEGSLGLLDSEATQPTTAAQSSRETPLNILLGTTDTSPPLKTWSPASRVTQLFSKAYLCISK